MDLILKLHVILVSNPFKEAVCIKSIAFPSAKFSLISTNTTSEAKFFIAIYSAQLVVQNILQ
jgi:hypothetical protein